MEEIFHQVSSYKVTSDFEGVRLDNCLISKLKGLPRTKIYSIIRKGEVRVNKSRAKPSQKLKIVDTELFGPVLSVIKFKTEEEVISLANDTKHGLAAGIFSRSNSRCLRLSKAIHAGIVWVNTYRVVSPIAEFGGFKNSGYGRESGFQAIYDYTRPKTVWMNMSDEPAADPFVMK